MRSSGSEGGGTRGLCHGSAALDSREVCLTVVRVGPTRVALLLAVAEDRQTVVDQPRRHRVLDQGLVRREVLEQGLDVVLEERSRGHGAALRPPVRSAVRAPEARRTHLVRLSLVADVGQGRDVA